MLCSSLQWLGLRPYSCTARLILCACCVLLATASATAQVGDLNSDLGDLGTGGTNTIQGSLYYNDGRRLDHRVRIKLRSAHVEQFTMSDQSGGFSFRKLKGGSYTVLVDAGTDF